MTRTRALTEYGPLVLFFLSNLAFGIMPATGVLVAATVVAVAFAMWRERRVPWLPVIGAVMVSTGLVPPEVFGELPLNYVAARANGTPTFRMFPFCDIEIAREQQRLGHESARQAIRS